MGKLLVEESSQPFEFGVVAQFLGGDDLVELVGENAIVGIGRQVGKRQLRPLSLARRFRIVHVVIEIVITDLGRIHVAVLGIFRCFVGLLGLAVFLGRGLVVFAFSIAVSGLRLIVLGRVLVFLGLLVAELVGHVERGYQVADRFCESRLVSQVMIECGNRVRRLLVDEFSPQPDELLRALRRLLAGELLAHHQRDGFLQRRIGAVDGILVIGAGVLFLQHRIEIAGNPFHLAGAERLDAGLFDPVIDCPCQLADGCVAIVNRLVMAGNPQRHGVAIAAGDRQLLPRNLAAWIGQLDLVADQRRAVVRKGNFDTRLVGDGAHAIGQGLLQRLIVHRPCVLLAVVTRSCHVTRSSGLRCVSRAPDWPTIPAIPRRTRADRTQPLSPVPVRHTC